MTATARIIVDGVDTFARFGVFALETGLNDLLAYPPLKTVEANDWHEQEGIDADLSAPRLNGREVSIKIGATGELGAPQTIAKIDAFLAFLRQSVYRVFRFQFLGGREYTLRLVGEPNLTIAQALGFVTLKFADDYPQKGYTYRRHRAPYKRRRTTSLTAAPLRPTAHASPRGRWPSSPDAPT